MSNRRHLVSRSRQNENSAPSSNRRGAVESTPAPGEQTIPLPPYEPPTCPLTQSAKQKIDELRSNRDVHKYNTHLKAALKTVSDSAAVINDRLKTRQDEAANDAKTREKQGVVSEEEIAEAAKVDQAYCKMLAKQVDVLTQRSEVVVRELIDLADEERMQDGILHDVEQGIPVTPAPRQRRRGIGEDGVEEEEGEAPVQDVEVLSAVELMKKGKEEYSTRYQARSMFQKYADHNDYRSFKKMVHDAQHPEDDAPPLPRANTWFPKDPSRRRSQNAADHTGNGDEDDSDDEIQIQSATTKLKCSLTLQFFKEPYANSVCPHVFEKEAIVGYYNENAVAFMGANGQRGAKKVKCPETGCTQMLTLDDFYIDELMRRKVKRAQKEELRQARGDDEEDEDGGPRGTQRNRPERIDSEGDDDAMDVDKVQRRSKIQQFKREKSAAASQRQRMPESEDSDDSDIEAMDTAQ